MRLEVVANVQLQSGAGDVSIALEDITSDRRTLPLLLPCQLHLVRKGDDWAMPRRRRDLVLEPVDARRLEDPLAASVQDARNVRAPR
jgi:hypothetical protein